MGGASCCWPAGQKRRKRGEGQIEERTEICQKYINYTQQSKLLGRRGQRSAGQRTPVGSAVLGNGYRGWRDTSLLRRSPWGRRAACQSCQVVKTMRFYISAQKNLKQVSSNPSSHHNKMSSFQKMEPRHPKGWPHSEFACSGPTHWLPSVWECVCVSVWVSNGPSKSTPEWKRVFSYCMLLQATETTLLLAPCVFIPRVLDLHLQVNKP